MLIKTAGPKGPASLRKKDKRQRNAAPERKRRVTAAVNVINVIKSRPVKERLLAAL